MSSEIPASQVAIQLLQEAYNEVEAKNYSAALQGCQAALAIYQKIGGRTGVAYTLTTIVDICRLSLESVVSESEEPLASESEEPVVSESEEPLALESEDSLLLLLEPELESSPSHEKFTNRLKIRIERGEPDIGQPPKTSRLIIEIDRPGEPEPPPPPPPRRVRLVIELTELEPPTPPSPSP